MVHLHVERIVTFEEEEDKKKHIKHNLKFLIHLSFLPSIGEKNKIDCNQECFVRLRGSDFPYLLNYFPTSVQGHHCVFLVLQIYLRFLDYEMQNSNECKRNFVAVYDGSSSVEDLRAKFCSTVANDVMLRTGLGVIRMWADEGSRNSRFQMLFTSFQERKMLDCVLPVCGMMLVSRGSLVFSSRSLSTARCAFRPVDITDSPFPGFCPSDRR